MNNICHIVGAGNFYPDKTSIGKDDFVIAADGGFDYIKKYNIKCDMVIGDFDSVLKEPNHGHIVKLPVEKDDTDMLAAVRFAMELGYRKFAIHGGTGDRPDHVFGNIQILTYLAQRKCIGILYGETMNITAIKDNDVTLPVIADGIISIFAHSECCGVTLKGLKYELDNYNMINSFPIGISNEFIDKQSHIIVQKGILIIMYDGKNRIDDAFLK